MFSPRHRSTLLCSTFMKFDRREIGEIVRYLHNKKKQNFACLSNCRYCCHRQPTTMYSECFRFYPNRLTFGGFIAERRNTAKSPSYANPIFGRRVASSRITSVQINLAKSRISDLSPSRNRLDSSDLDPHLTHCSLDPLESAPNTAS